MSPPTRVIAWTALGAALVLFADLTSGQTLWPSGDEFPLREISRGDQKNPSVAFTADGGYLVWEDNGIDRWDPGIAACKIDGDLNPASPPFRVPFWFSGEQKNPEVAMMPDGRALFAWEGIIPRWGWRPERIESFMRFAGGRGGWPYGKDIILTPVYTRQRSVELVTRLSWVRNQHINKRWALKTVVDTFRRETRSPQPVPLPNGNVLVVYSGVRQVATWRTEIQTQTWSRWWWGRTIQITNDFLVWTKQEETWEDDVILRLYNFRGWPIGQEIVVNEFLNNNQNQPAATVLSDGNVLITWVSETRVDENDPSNSRIDIQGRIFNPDGTPVGGEFQVNNDPRFTTSPAVASDAEGGFTVAWTQKDLVRSNSWDIFARHFDAAGEPDAPAFRVNQRTFGDQYDPSIASVGANALLVWTSLAEDGSREGVYGRLLSRGEASGNAFRVNTTADHGQLEATVATDGTRLLTAWAGFTRASQFDIYGQAFETTQPPPEPELGSQPESDPLLTDTEGGESSSGGGDSGEAPLPPVVPAGTSGGGALRARIFRSEGGLRLAWTTETGGVYQVQVSRDLAAWLDWGEPREGTGVEDGLLIAPKEAALWYRIIKLR